MLINALVHRRNSYRPVQDTGWLVRYRFASVVDLYRHLRLGQGFFVPQPIPGEPISRAIVEITFPEGGDKLLLHGNVRVRSPEGAWLDVPSARTTARWMAGPAGPRREQVRMACDLFVEVRPRGTEPWLCRGLDVGAGGLRLAAGSMELGVAGDEIDLTMLSPDPQVAPVRATARLAWAGVREAGLQIVSTTPEMRDLLRAVEERWAAVREIDHDAACPCSRPPMQQAG
ncbi:MAG: PilZ domain-containing protein [Myxococcales bacterium]|nr:PilZ domain-containing protein [Myxococcales bacterium]